jgi:hypothetical protein
MPTEWPPSWYDWPTLSIVELAEQIKALEGEMKGKENA